MMLLKKFALLAGAALLLLPAAFAGPQRPGKWEITTQMDMPGMSVPANTTTICISPKDAENPDKAVPHPQSRPGHENNCKVSDYKVDGNKVSWTMKCEGDHPMSGAGEITYSADSYTGLFKINAQGRDMAIKYNGKRLGDCDK